MSDDRSLERAARLWLEDGPNVAPDRAVDAALARIESTPQERGPLVPWRLPTMNLAVKIAGAAAIVVAAVVGSTYLLNGGGIGGPPASVPPDPTPASVAPSVTQAPTATPAPTALETPSWETFVSERYQFSIMHPADWNAVPAEREWDFETDAAEFLNPGTDMFQGPGIRVTAWSVAVPEGTTLAEWVQAYCEVATEPCDDIQGVAEEAYAEERDRHPGVIVPLTFDIHAFFPSWVTGEEVSIWDEPATGDARIYIVASWRPPDEFNSRELLTAMSRSMCLGCTTAP